MKEILFLVVIIIINGAITYAQCVQFVNYPADTINWKEASDHYTAHHYAFYNNDTFVITTSTGGEDNYIYAIPSFTLNGTATVFTASFYFRMDSLSSCSDGLSFWFFTSSLHQLGTTGLEGCALGYPDTVAGFALAMQTTVCVDNIYMKKLNATNFSFCGMSYTTPSSATDTNIATPLPHELFLSDSQWHLCTVNYNRGTITTTFYTDTGTIVLTGYSLLYGTGHFGFMATNGAGYTRKSLRDIQICVNSIGGITGDTSICIGDTTTLSDTTMGGTWSSDLPGITTIDSVTGTVIGVSAGTSVITYSTSNGFATTTMTVNPLPNAGTITGDSTVCIGTTITLSNTTSGGIWSSSNNGMATISPAGIVTPISAGADTISYTVTNSCGSATATAIINVAVPGNAGTLTGDSVVCIGTPITLSDTVSGGTWSSSNNGIATISSSGVVAPVSTGVDTISYTVTNSCGTATATAIINVAVPGNAGTISGDTAVCAGSAITLSDNVTGGVWGTNNAAIATVSGDVITGLSTGTATIDYSVTNSCGTAIATENVTVLAAPAAGSISGTPVVCIGAVLPLSDNVTGGTWSNSNLTVATINSNTGIAYALAMGNTVISYTTSPNIAGCNGISTYTVTVVESAFTITSTVTQVSCFGNNNGSISTGFGGSISSARYLWSNGNNTSAITGLDTGQYTLIVSDSTTQCVEKDTFHITQPAPLNVSDSTTDDMCHTGTGIVSVTVSGGTPFYHYAWSNGGTGSTISDLIAGVYSVTVTDSNSCTKNISATVQEDTCSGIVIHDVITPNGDGINDVWVIEGISEYPNNTVQVYDKWGDMVYEKSNYNNDWGGKGKSGEVPDGTYYYLVKLNAKNQMGGQNTWTGYLLIKR